MVTLLHERLEVFVYLKKIFGQEPVANNAEPPTYFAALCRETGDEHLRYGLSLWRLSARHDGDTAAVVYDYNRLFVGPDKLQAPPYESVYTSEDRLVMQDSTRAVRRFYAAFGIVPARLNREPDDSAALELEFYSYLQARTIEALQAQDVPALREFASAQQRFYNEHLAVWLPSMCRLVLANARTDYYRAAAHLTLGVLAYEPVIISDFQRALNDGIFWARSDGDA